MVADNGVGLPPVGLSAGHSSLGLQLVTTLAEQLDADFLVKRNHGTTFRLEFDVTS